MAVLTFAERFICTLFCNKIVLDRCICRLCACWKTLKIATTENQPWLEHLRCCSILTCCRSYPPSNIFEQFPFRTLNQKLSRTRYIDWIDYSAAVSFARRDVPTNHTELMYNGLTLSLFAELVCATSFYTKLRINACQRSNS